MLLFFLDVPLAALVLVSLVPLFLLFRWFSARATDAFRRTRGRVATMIVNIVETFNGIRAVQAFRREKRNDAIFAGLNASYADANREAFRLHAVFIPGTTLIGNVSTVAVLLVGGWRVLNGGMEIGVLTAFLLYLRQFFGPMEDVAIFYNSLQSATAALEKISVGARRACRAWPSPAQPVAAPRTGPRRAALRRASSSATSPTGRCCTRCPSTSPPGRPSRSSARPVRARRRSPS